MNEENTGARESNNSDAAVTEEESMNKGYISRSRNTDKKNRSPEEYFRWGVFGITMLLLFIAAIQFYFSMQDAISTWFEWEYVSLFKSVYNLVIIGLCIYIIKLFVFRKQA